MRRTSLAIAALVIAVAGTGVGYATAASTPTKAGACLTVHNNLAVAKNGHCGKNQRRISVPLTAQRGATGATGRTGATGKTGLTGKTGATGLSQARSVDRAVGPADLTSTQTVVATMSGLPAGAWVLSGRTTVSGAASDLVTCKLTAQSDADSASAVAGAEATLSLSLTHTFTGTGVVTLSCAKAAAAGAISVASTRIVAIKVDSESHADVTG